MFTHILPRIGTPSLNIHPSPRSQCRYPIMIAHEQKREIFGIPFLLKQQLLGQTDAFSPGLPFGPF